jgi:hypothetical protein
LKLKDLLCGKADAEIVVSGLSYDGITESLARASELLVKLTYVMKQNEAKPGCLRSQTIANLRSHANLAIKALHGADNEFRETTWMQKVIRKAEEELAELKTKMLDPNVQQFVLETETKNISDTKGGLPEGKSWHGDSGPEITNQTLLTLYATWKTQYSWSEHKKLLNEKWVKYDFVVDLAAAFELKEENLGEEFINFSKVLKTAQAANN